MDGWLTGKIGGNLNFRNFIHTATLHETLLPGYNFTRLPLRVFVTEGKNVGEYISRSRPIALREYGPMSFIYYNGRKYQSVQLVDQEIESKVLKAKISLKSG